MTATEQPEQPEQPNRYGQPDQPMTAGDADPPPVSAPAHEVTPPPGRPRTPRGRAKRTRNVRIMPGSGVGSNALTAVIAVMCYLGALALGAVILINKSVNSWTSDIAGQITVQVQPSANRNINADVDRVLAILRASRGIAGASIISERDSARLLEPWLGSAAFLKDLPVPRLVAVSINRTNPPDLKALAATLKTNVPSATLDTHRQWRGQIVRSAGTLKLIGYAVLTLISLTTAAIVVFATRAAMASNAGTVEVLHLIGAQDSFIAQLIQWQFLWLGLRAGIIAGLLGAISFYGLNLLSDAASTGALSGSATRLLALPALLAPVDFLAFLLVPIAATLIAMITARLAILRILSQVL